MPCGRVVEKAIVHAIAAPPITSSYRCVEVRMQEACESGNTVNQAWMLPKDGQLGREARRAALQSGSQARWIPAVALVSLRAEGTQRPRLDLRPPWPVSKAQSSGSFEGVMFLGLAWQRNMAGRLRGQLEASWCGPVLGFWSGTACFLMTLYVFFLMEAAPLYHSPGSSRSTSQKRAMPDSDWKHTAWPSPVVTLETEQEGHLPLILPP